MTTQTTRRRSKARRNRFAARCRLMTKRDPETVMRNVVAWDNIVCAYLDANSGARREIVQTFRAALEAGLRNEVIAATDLTDVQKWLRPRMPELF